MTRFAWVISAAVVLAAAPSWAAPQAKRCIDAAETGQQLRSSGRLMSARRSFAVCTSPSCPSAVRRDCARWIEEVDAALPTVAVRLEDENGHEISEGKVLVDDGAPIEPSAGRALPIDPGAHKFTWVRTDGKIEQDVVIREGEHNRAIVLRVASAATPPAIGPDRPPPASTPSTSHSSPLPLIVGTIGVAAIAAGGAFWFVGLRERSNLELTCRDAHTCAQGDIDASRSKLIVGDVFAGLGIVALAGALYLFLSQSSQPAPAAASSAQR